MAAVTGRLLLPLGWGDCDPAGIIFSPTYYRWMDAATWALVAQAGYPAARMRADHLTLPLVDSRCEFLSSPTFGDTCEVLSQVTRWGRSSFTVAHEFRLAGTERVLARGSESRVWCRYTAGPGTPLASVSLPDDLRGALGGPPA